MSDAYLTETLAAIEETIANEEAKIILGEQLNRLLKTDDFNAVIGEALLTNYVKKATDIIINTLDPESPEVREALDKISFVNRLKEFFEEIQKDAMYAPSRIEQEQLYRKEITAETSED
jgi:hypothetical protein